MADHVPSRAPVKFVDLQSQRRRLGASLETAIARVLDHGQFIMGPEVADLEGRLAAFGGAKHAIACANGTDALALGLMAKGLKPGEAVFVPSFTFVATAEVVVWLGATPVFVDVDPETFNLDAASLEEGIRTAHRLGLAPRAVIAVDLFGQPVDYDSIEPLCAQHGLWLLADAAQSFGATYRGRRVGQIGEIAATSFFPSKPLGCYGDGGCVFTDDDDLAASMRSLRVHGQGQDKYDNVRVGMNGRLDTLQAAILLQKLAVFPEEIVARGEVARCYKEGLQDVVRVPRLIEGASSVWAQYTIVIEDDRRTALAAELKRKGIPTAIYYPKPLHRQTAYQRFPVAEGGLSVSEHLVEHVLSLPMHAYLEADTQAFIIENLRTALR